MDMYLILGIINSSEKTADTPLELRRKLPNNNGK